MNKSGQRRIGERGGIFCTTLVMGCGLELPEPPDLEPLNDQYESPTLVLGQSKVEALVATYTEERARIARVGNLRDIRALAADLDRRVTVSSDGERQTVEINGVPVRTNAALTLYGRCSEADDPSSESIVAEAIVRESRFVPVVWGDLDDCAVRSELDPTAPARLWGTFEVFIPTLTTSQTPIHLIRYDLSRVQVDGLDEPGWSGDLRYVGETVEVLVADLEGDTAVLSGGPRPIVEVRAANGRWRCFVEQQQCESDSGEPPLSY